MFMVSHMSSTSTPKNVHRPQVKTGLEKHLKM